MSERIDRTEAPADPLLSLEGVSAAYGETAVLHGVSMAVGEGEIVSLVGRNGAGKTTTLRTVVGDVEPTAGTITYRGADITGTSPVAAARDGIALVPEERRIFPGLTVRENLELGAIGGARNAKRRSVGEVLGTFENLTEREDSLGATLSGGEQQMLSIARALVAGADLLLLDEPTEGLAPYIVQRVADLVTELNGDGITVLLIEQNVQVALALADRHYVLDRGRIVYHGTSEQLESDEEIMERHLGVSA